MSADLQKTVKQRTTNIPRKDADVVTLGKSVGAAWTANPAIKLLWTTVEAYKADVLAYDAALNERMSIGGERKGKTGKLKELDARVEEGVSLIKNALAYKYGKKEAITNYPQFGIVRHGNSFIIPKDRSKRLAALKLTLAAVATHGMGAEKYGTAYWQEIIENYNTLQTEAAVVDGAVAGKVSTKNELRASILKTNNALIHVLKGNYPDTWKSVIREWGFQKEKY